LRLSSARRDNTSEKASPAGGPARSLSDHIEQVRSRLDAAQAARETGIPASRAAIQAAANSIRAAHRQQWNDAQAKASECRALLDRAQEALRDFPHVYHAGFLHDAEKEYVEASTTIAVLRHGRTPGPEELKVGDPAYLNGMAETIGELRRFLLDRLREGEFDRGEELLGWMDDIHDLLATLDYPDALTAGLRRSTDVARAILERTRGDLTASAVQARLTQALQAHTER
jgi:translin